MTEEKRHELKEAQKIALDDYRKEAAKARRDAIAQCADILATAFYEYHGLYGSYIDNFIYGLLDELKRETQMKMYELHDTESENDE